MKMYLGISGLAYMCIIAFRVVQISWLKSFQINRGGLPKNMSDGKYSVKHFEYSLGMDSAKHNNLPVLICINNVVRDTHCWKELLLCAGVDRHDYIYHMFICTVA